MKITKRLALPTSRGARIAQPGVDALPTYYTISDARYFAGTVATLNSIRLTGNAGEFVVLDTGLTPSQRERLAPHATLPALSLPAAVSPVFLRPAIRELSPSGIVVFLDSDVIVTASLDAVIRRARGGQICAAPDLQQRFFPEWEEIFGLSRAPRRQTYINTGLVAFSVDRWPALLQRWWEASERIIALDPPRLFSLDNESAAGHPFAYNDQDALNALLMSELPEGALSVIEPAAAPTIHDLRRVQCIDLERLRCVNDGHEVTLIHYINGPKPWEPNGWISITDDAYVRLLPRLLLASDVTLRVSPAELPGWLRGGRRGRLLLAGLRATTGALRSLARGVPGPVYERVISPLKARLRGLGR